MDRINALICSDDEGDDELLSSPATLNKRRGAFNKRALQESDPNKIPRPCSNRKIGPVVIVTAKRKHTPIIEHHVVQDRGGSGGAKPTVVTKRARLAVNGGGKGAAGAQKHPPPTADDFLRHSPNDFAPRRDTQEIEKDIAAAGQVSEEERRNSPDEMATLLAPGDGGNREEMPAIEGKVGSKAIEEASAGAVDGCSDNRLRKNNSGAVGDLGALDSDSGVGLKDMDEGAACLTKEVWARCKRRIHAELGQDTWLPLDRDLPFVNKVFRKKHLGLSWSDLDNGHAAKQRYLRWSGKHRNVAEEIWRIIVEEYQKTISRRPVSPDNEQSLKGAGAGNRNKIVTKFEEQFRELDDNTLNLVAACLAKESAGRNFHR
jgi:hypothetical protein